jgi:hypothetical protein
MKLTKTKLKTIIKEELKKVLKENSAKNADVFVKQAEQLYEKYWKKAVDNYYENEVPADHYKEYDPDSEYDPPDGPPAYSNVNQAHSHLKNLLYRNEEDGGELTIKDIFKAIEDGWHDSIYEFDMQQEMY